MKCSFALLLLIASPVVIFSAETPASAVTQAGRLSTARLLKVTRGPAQEAPDGLTFHFLVTRTPAATGRFTLKETRDFLLAGQSYQAKTQAELGRRFEPGTTINDAEKFFASHADVRGLAPADVKGALVLSITIAGAKLPQNSEAAITLHIGYDKQVEPLQFRVPVPSN